MESWADDPAFRPSRAGKSLLVAAMQYCGFSSAVKTTWAMADVDGPDPVRHFYRSMFAKRKKLDDVLYYKRSAEALRICAEAAEKEEGFMSGG